MADRLDDVARAGLTLGADERSALGDAAQSFAEVTRAAYKGHLERMFIDVVLFVRRREHLRLVDVVNTDGLEDLRRMFGAVVWDRRTKAYLRFNEVPYPHLRHDWDRHSIDDLLNHFGVTLRIAFCD